MGEFWGIFKKVNGWKQLNEYRKSHILIFVLAETLMLGTSRKSLEIVRLAAQNKIYQRLKKQNKSLVEEFLANHPYQDKQPHRNTIWTAWLQGIENAPEIVKICYQSLKENIKDKEIVCITEKNYSNYVNFPDYITNKYDAGIISKTHFADLLRIELLSRYGGTWLDGTVFCSGLHKGVHDFYLESDLFLYQNLKPGLDGHATAISSWMITASANQNIILLTREMLHNYWNTHNYAADYFVLHDLFQIAIEAYEKDWKKVVPISNSMPHVLLLNLFDEYDENVWRVIKDIIPFHKLSYKYDAEQTTIANTYYKALINKRL